MNSPGILDHILAAILAFAPGCLVAACVTWACRQAGLEFVTFDFQAGWCMALFYSAIARQRPACRLARLLRRRSA